jgi:hypothetical protein
VASIPSTLGGRNHGHAGVIAETAKYSLMTGRTVFVNPANPGVYPAGLLTNATAGSRARKEAIHKELVAQYEIFKGVEQGLKDIIQEAVEADYLLEIEDKTLGFLNQTPRQMIDHLRNRGGALDFADTKALLVKRDTEWNVNEVPLLYFNRVEKAMRGITRAGINSNLNERRDMALFYLKATGEFDAAVREWEAKPEADKTWTNIKSFISTEYTKENKQNKLMAKQFKANAMEEQAKATEELINALTENHTRQMEALIRSTTEAMKEMMTLVKSDNKNPTNANNRTNEKKTKWQEKQNKYKDAPVCKHCNRKHPNQQESECWPGWELKSKAKSRPTWWRPNKST